MAKKWNPKYEYNLRRVFDRAYKGESKALRTILRPTLKEKRFRDILSTRIIDKIVDRTLDGIDMFDRPFPSYSEEYINSLKFKAFGKSKSPNLRLTGSMLSDLNATDAYNTIVFNLRTRLNRAKADGHMTGWRGKNVDKARPFLGLPPNVEEEILIKAIKEYRQSSLVIEADLFDFDLGIL